MQYYPSVGGQLNFVQKSMDFRFDDTEKEYCTVLAVMLSIVYLLGLTTMGSNKHLCNSILGVGYVKEKT